MSKPPHIQPPRELERSGGYRQRKKIGRIWRRMVVDEARLPRDGAVLDVGCGLGRMAVPLAGYLSARGRYEGYDVDAEAIRWCRQNIAVDHPNFHFTAAPVRSKRYNPRGATEPSRASLPYEDAAFDVVILASVFTHMLPDAVERYLHELARVLKPGGRCLATFFLLNDASEKAIAEGRVRALHRFPVRLDGCRLLNEEVPESAVAYDETRIRALYRVCGFSILEPIRYGTWAGRESALGQDVVHAQRATVPCRSSTEERRR